MYLIDNIKNEERFLMPNVLNKIKTQQNVEALRSAMIKSGTENGLNHPTTIKLSQNLDKLLNEYTLTFSN